MSCVKSQITFCDAKALRCLWSIFDMAHRFRVASFATVMGQLRESATLINFSRPGGPSPEDVVRAALKEADKEIMGFISIHCCKSWISD